MYENIEIEPDKLASYNRLVVTLNSVAAVGFVIIAVSTFLKFVPIVNVSWLKLGMGTPIMFTAFAGAFLVLFKKYFASFFAVVFCAFFAIHNIIITYDKKAIALDAVSGKNGWMRSLVDIFKNALSPDYGAFWVLVGVFWVLFLLIVAWAFNTYIENGKAFIDTLSEESKTVEISNIE